MSFKKAYAYCILVRNCRLCGVWLQLLTRDFFCFGFFFPLLILSYSIYPFSAFTYALLLSAPPFAPPSASLLKLTLLTTTTTADGLVHVAGRANFQLFHAAPAFTGHVRQFCEPGVGCVPVLYESCSREQRRVSLRH